MKTIYTKDNCPACILLKAELKRNEEEFIEINIGKDITREDFIAKFPKQRTVPFVVNDADSM
jgi:glutaredoxin